MKKNKMMRLASLLLVCVLLTTSVIGGTFAKYITTDAGSDTARVAKWGIDVLVSGNLFGTDYADVKATENPNSIVAATSDSVSSNADLDSDGKNDDVVAPGTKNLTGLTIKLSGTPEVAYKVTARTGANIKDEAGAAKPANEDIFLGAGCWGVMVKAEGLNIASDVTGLYTSDGTSFTPASNPYVSTNTYYELHDTVTVAANDDYYPIVWTVSAANGAKEVATQKNLVTIAEDMVTNIVANRALDDVIDGTTFKANTNAAASYVLTWEWPFESATPNANTHVAPNDAKDTILGNLMADKIDAAEGVVVYKADANAASYGAPVDGTNYNLDIVFNFDVIVEQVD